MFTLNATSLVGISVKSQTTSHQNKTRENMETSNVCEILPNLFLGDRIGATDVETIQKFNFSHILSLDMESIPDQVQQQCPNLKTKLVRILDLETENILDFFEEAHEFIDDAIENKTKVLVHCVHGVSRSATIVISYLMKHLKTSLNSAFTKVKEKRSCICPNRGFWQQLKLYEQMNCKIDLDFKPYKMFKLLMDCQKITNSHYVHETVSKAKVQTRNNVRSTYKCKKCRKTLATDVNVFNHHPLESEIHLSFETFKESINCCKNGIFLENMDWMTSDSLQSDKLSCDKCGSKIGSFSWTKKVSCPCGTSMIPGFFINMKRIDVSNLYVKI